MKEEDLESKSVQGTTFWVISSSDEEEYNLNNPGPGQHQVSTTDLRMHVKTSSPWWESIHNNLPGHKPKNARCKKCPSCVGSNKKGCVGRGEVRAKCFGCQNQETCSGMFPCQERADEEKAGFYAHFSLQAYEFTSAANQVDLIQLGPYRLDLDLNGGT